MKNVCLKVGLIALALALVFGVALIVLAVKKEYAENHYKYSYKETPYYISSDVLGIENEIYYYAKGYGCGEKGCKYCQGVAHRKTNEDFIYYRTIRGFWIASIFLTSISGVTASVAIPLHFKRAKTRGLDREDY